MQDLLNTPDAPSLESQEVFPLYFRKLHGRAHSLGEQFDEWLAKNARSCQFQFREAAAEFRMIDEGATPVVVRYGENAELLERLRTAGPKRDVMRSLQRFVVTVPKGMVVRLKEVGCVEEMHSGVFVQTLDSFYSEEFGLCIIKTHLGKIQVISGKKRMSVAAGQCFHK